MIDAVVDHVNDMCTPVRNAAKSKGMGEGDEDEMNAAYEQWLEDMGLLEVMLGKNPRQAGYFVGDSVSVIWYAGTFCILFAFLLIRTNVS